jgi:predicted ABC-type ATPase
MPVVEDAEDLAASLNAAARDPRFPPAERVADVRRIRDGIPEDHPDFTALSGQADTYIGSLELQREAEAIAAPFDEAAARENADIRDALIARGLATDEELAGWPSHEQLDAMSDDGSLAEAAFGLALKTGEEFNQAVHRDHGKFSKVDVMGGAAKDAVHAVHPPAARALRQRGSVRKPLPGGPAAPIKPQVVKPPKAPQSPGTAQAIADIDSLDSVAAQLEEVRKYGLNDWPTKGPLAQQLLGDAPDTQHLHTVELPASPGTEGGGGQRAYTAERKGVHDRIIGSFLHAGVSHVLGEDHPIAQKLAQGGTLSDDEKQTVRDAAAAKRGPGRARALFMAGGPASGKTSALKAAPELEPDGAVLINPDEIKDRLPEYRAMIEAGEKFGASGVHEESSDLGKRLQSEAMDLGLNVVVDGTGDSKKGKFAGKMKDMDGAGYDVSALYVTIPTDSAVVRATKRAMKSGRWVPEPEIRSQHKNVSANFEDVAALPFLKDLKLYDNSGEGDPVLAAEAAGGKTTVHDDATFSSFLEKAKEGERLAEASDDDTEDPSAPEVDHGEFAHEEQVPVQDWIPHPVSDSSDYLDRQPPAYVEQGEVQ